MRYGILADIHEHVEYLREALNMLQHERVDKLLLLGDIAVDGKRIDETVSLLRPFAPCGVWGNHDLGLAHNPSDHFANRYGTSIIEFFSTLKSQFEIGDILVTHGLPTWDATDPTAYYLGKPPWTNGSLTSEFQQVTHRIILVGHFHRWFASTLRHPIAWRGKTVLSFSSLERYFVIVGALFQGSFAILDTDADSLTPFSITA